MVVITPDLTAAKGQGRPCGSSQTISESHTKSLQVISKKRGPLYKKVTAISLKAVCVSANSKITGFSPNLYFSVN